MTAWMCVNVITCAGKEVCGWAALIATVKFVCVCVYMCVCVFVWVCWYGCDSVGVGAPVGVCECDCVAE